MKIQCACGAKYAFEVQPEMLQQPVRFVCPSCGLDSSACVNELVRQQLAAPAPDPAAAGEFSETPRVRLHTSSGPPVSVSAVESDARVCARHHGQPAVESCRVCHQPMCAKCMELFGYVCSPRCRQKARFSGLNIPEFSGQRDVVQRRFWRRINLVAGALGSAVVAALGVWFWWVWFGSTPKPIFSVRFAEPAYSGQSAFAGTDQIIFLHGGTLARHDMKARREVWSRALVDPEKIQRQVAETLERLRRTQQKLDSDFPDADPIRVPSPEKLAARLNRAAAEELELYVRDRGIWVSSFDKVVRYDWDTGQPVREIPMRGGLAGALARGDEMWLIRETESGQNLITRLNLATGVMQTNGVELAIPPTAVLADAHSATTEAALTTGARQPLDPDQVASQVQRLPLPARIALPATLSVGRGQERLLSEMSGPSPVATEVPDYRDRFELRPAPDGFVQFSVRLLEHRMIERSAMRAAPRKSALDGPVSVTAITEIANEILNEMQRERGGGTVFEDHSRYQVTVRIPGAQAAPEWQGEVVGAPGLYPLRTVNVVAAGKTVIVLDKGNRKKWEATLTYDLGKDAGSMDEANAPYGLGPLVERDGSLFAMDEGVLTAFDLANGNARWRLPSVGLSGLFFDADGMIYVNSTTASPDRIKFSRQIDIAERVSAVVLKIDAKTGRILWTAEPGGPICHVAGKNIFCLKWFQPDDQELDNLYIPDTGFETPPYLRLKRLNPRNGRIMWEHFQQRAPLDVQFERNSIRLVFKKEVQVLRFLSF